MSDPHDRFEAWLADGALGDPPRDLALHAASCTECLAMAGALDDLEALDLEGAELPPMLARSPAAPARLATAARWIATMAALGVVALTIAILGSGWPVGSERGGDAAAFEPTARGEDVLGDAAGPGSTAGSATAGATGSPSATPAPTDDPGATSAASPVLTIPVPGQPAPTAAPFPTGPTVPVGTPRPSASPTPVPSPTGPTPTPTPTTTPEPTPTPTPTTTPEPTPRPTPTPNQTPGGESTGSDVSCTNGSDDDGDLLVDLLDPGCLVGGTEADL